MLSHHREQVSSNASTQSKTEEDFSIAYTFLSLFLLVLSFFVVLTVLSEVVQERVQQALSSVAEVFSPISIESKVRSNPLNLRAAGFTNDFILDEIEILVESDIHVAKTTRNDKEGTLEVRIVNKALFQDNKPEIRPEMVILLKRISSTIASGNSPTYTSFITSYSTDETYVFTPPLSVRRAGELSKIALQEGISPERIQSGLDTALDEETIFRFQIGDASFPNVRYIPNRKNQPIQEEIQQGVLIESGATETEATNAQQQ